MTTVKQDCSIHFIPCIIHLIIWCAHCGGPVSRFIKIWCWDEAWPKRATKVNNHENAKVNNHENANGGKKSKSRGGKEQRLPSAHLGQNKGNKEGRRCWKTYRQLVNGSNIAAPNNYGSSIQPKKATTKARPINRQTLHSNSFQQSRGRVHSAYLLLQQECRIIKIIGRSKAIQIKWKLAFVLKK